MASPGGGPNLELIVVGGVLVIGLVYMATKGGSSSTGVSFASANPQSVAAVMAANSSNAANADAAQTARDGLATSLLGLQLTTNAGVKTNADNNRTSLALATTNNDSALKQVTIQAATADTVAAYNTQVALNTANQATAQAKIIGNTDTSIASIAATTSRQATTQGNITARQVAAGADKTAVSEATLAHLTADNVATQQAQAQVQTAGDQEAASNTASMWGGISGIVGGIAKAIPFSNGPASNGPITPASQSPLDQNADTTGVNMPSLPDIGISLGPSWSSSSG